MAARKKIKATDEVADSTAVTHEASSPATGEEAFATDPVLRYLLGSAIGGRCGLCPIWHTKPLTYEGRQYFAEIEDGILKVQRSGNIFEQVNADQAYRKAQDVVGRAKRIFDDVASQVKATEDARDRAAAELERATVQRRSQAEKILESWDMTLAEIRPRLEDARAKMEAAETARDLVVRPQAEQPEVYSTRIL